MPIAPELLAYLENCKSQGLPFAAVSDQLLASGWSKEALTEAEAWYIGHPSSLPEVSSVVTRSPSISKKSFHALPFVLGLLIFLFLAGSVSAFLIATDKISLPDSFLKNHLTRLVYSLPFMSKTPKVVLGLTIMAHKNVSKNSFNLSVAASSANDQIKNVFGTNNLDLSMIGNIDYSDPKNPQASFSANLNKDLSTDIRAKDKMIYIKINKVPLLATSTLSLIGIRPSDIDPLLRENWLSIDTSTLDTPARSSIDNKEIQASTILTTILDEEILPLVTMSKTDLVGLPVYKLSLDVTPELLDKLTDKLSALSPQPSIQDFISSKTSDILKNVKITLYIDRQNYLIQRLDLSTLLNLAASQAQSTSLSIVAVLQLTDFGRDTSIVIPSSSLPFDQFIEQVLNLSDRGAINPKLQLDKAKYSMAQNDLSILSTALISYSTNHKDLSYPNTLQELVTSGDIVSIEFVERSKILYKKAKNGKDVIIYSQIPSPIDLEKPYLGFETQAGIAKNYSQAELDAL